MLTAHCTKQSFMNANFITLIVLNFYLLLKLLINYLFIFRLCFVCLFVNLISPLHFVSFSFDFTFASAENV